MLTQRKRQRSSFVGVDDGVILKGSVDLTVLLWLVIVVVIVVYVCKKYFKNDSFEVNKTYLRVVAVVEYLKGGEKRLETKSSQSLLLSFGLLWNQQRNGYLVEQQQQQEDTYCSRLCYKDV